MGKVLFVPFFPGELGWEIINYVPHVNYLCSQEQYDEIHVMVREGREALYPMGTHFYPIRIISDSSMGNSGIKPSISIRSSIKSVMNSKLQGILADEVSIPPHGCQLFSDRKFLKYEASALLLNKWDYLPQNSVTLLVRGRTFGPHKNWESTNWVSLCHFLLDKSLIPIIVGIKGNTIFKIPAGCIDLQNKTTLGDLLAIFKKTQFTIGQSTGTAHFASLAGIPHLIWGSSRIAKRYLRSWNPHNTFVKYLSCKNEFDCSINEVCQVIEDYLQSLSV